MSTVYVTEPGVQIHKQGQRLLVKRNGEVLQDIPMIKVSRLVLMGRGVSVTTPTLYALTRNKIDVLYLNSRGGYMLRMVGREHNHSRLRHAQALAINNKDLALHVSRALVTGKVLNQRVLVQRHAERAGWAQDALRLMAAMYRQVETSQTLDELRGREGVAAREYFRLMRQLIRPPSDGQAWGFERREYYPPVDPINALLSFGYTMLLNDLIAACQIAGLDPDLGFFHAIDYNKPSMALDLEEEFRPIIVDSIVLAAVNRPLFGLSDFEVEASRREPAALPGAGSVPAGQQPSRQIRPVYLKEDARRKFIGLYEARVNEQIVYPLTGERTTYRRIFELQAYQMGRAILGELDAYRPMLVR